MKKAFKFVESLTSLHYELLGYPTIKIFNSDFVEVSFNTDKVIRNLKIFELSGYDEFRFFAGNNDCITFVYTFYNEEY